MLFMLTMGYIQKRFSKDSSDFFRGGCKSPWWLAGASAFMAGISAYSFTGAAGVAFESGWSIVAVYAAGALGFLLSSIFTAHLFRQLRMTTAPEANSTLVSWVHPPAWKIDDYPFVRFRIRIDNGTPLGVYLLAFSKRDWGKIGDTTARRLCIARTPSAVPVASEIAEGMTILADDEQWHEYVLDVSLIRECYQCEIYLEGLHFEACPQNHVLNGQWYELDYLFIEPKSSLPVISLPEIAGDLNSDCRVNFDDIQLFFERWLLDCTYPNNLTDPMCN
jgi:hypothetical protein